MLTTVNNGDTGLVSRNKINAGLNLLNNHTEDSGVVTGLIFNCANIPDFIFGVYKNGVRLTAAIDYSVAGLVITFVEALVADNITVVYRF